MKSALSPVCDALTANQSADEFNAIVTQYVSTFDTSFESIQTLTNDPLLSEFIQFLNAALYSSPIPKPGEGAVPQVVVAVLKFMNTLLTSNSLLLDTIAASCNLDNLIPQFFDANLGTSGLMEIEVSHLFLPLKFVALVASSKRVKMNSTTAADTMIAVACSLLNNPQLSAWAAACIAGFCRHCESFSAVLKSHPMLGALKADLTTMLPSCDPCVVVAGLAATVMLFNVGDNADTALTAAMKYLVEESQFQLATQLCSWTILSLASKVKLLETDLTSLLGMLLGATGMRACTIYSLFSQLIDMKYRFGRQDQVKEIMMSLLHCEDDFVSVAGCQFLFNLAANVPSIMTGIDADGSLTCDALHCLNDLAVKDNTERTESVLMIIRLLIDGSGINDIVLETLKAQEDLLFTNFIRNIEANHAFLSVSFFSILMICAKHLPKWVLRVKRVLVESQFAALLAHVLTSSQNRKAIADALMALQFYTNDCEPTQAPRNTFFLDSAVSGFLVVNQRREEPQQVPIQVAGEATVRAHENETQRMLREIASLKASLASESNRAAIINECNLKLGEEIRKREHDIIHLQQEVSKLTIEINDKQERLTLAQASLEERRKENAELLEQVESFKGEKAKNRALQKRNQEMESHISDLETHIDHLKSKQQELRSLTKALNRELRKRETELVSVQKTCDEAQQRNSDLHASITSLSADLKSVQEENASLQSSLQDTTDENSRLSQAITALESQNLELRSSIRTAAELKSQYDLKAASLRAKLHQLEDEKRKWEGIAKFVHEVGTIKSETVRQFVTTMCKPSP